jgi:hypothetical protein
VSINFNDPESIAAWIAIRPERHTAMLRGLWLLWPMFREQIEAAVAACSKSTPEATP